MASLWHYFKETGEQNTSFSLTNAHLKDYHAWFLDHSNIFENLQGWFLLDFYFFYIT